MTSYIEFYHRLKEFLRFSQKELVMVLLAVLVTGFIFSFRDWGAESFDLAIGLRNFIIALFVAFLTFIIRISCQKMMALSVGYKSEFRLWILGIILALIFAFISDGYLPLVLAGGMATALMLRQRIGEFRYGLMLSEESWIGAWGIFGNILLTIFFSIGNYFFPESYFFSIGITINLVMAACSLLPLPQLDGLKIFFGHRILYFASIGITVIFSLLLTSHRFGLLNQRSGLIISVILAAVLGMGYFLTISDR
jgi:Zn-dependent protease